MIKVIKKGSLAGLPTEVDVLGRHYTIRELSASEREVAYGMCVRCPNEGYSIAIDTSIVSKRKLAEVVIHEVMHAIYYEKGMAVTEQLVTFKDLEEFVVSNLSAGLTAVLINNPILLAYYLENLKK